MKSSGTSTNKNKKINSNNIKKNSTGPSRPKVKKRTSTNHKKNTRNNFNTNKKNTVNKEVRKNNHSAKNNLRLNKVSQDVEYVPFFDDEIVPNNIRKVKPDNSSDISHKDKKNVKIKASTIIKFTFFIAFVIIILYLIFNMDTFNLSSIVVRGNEIYSEEEIISKSSLNMGDNVFKQLFLSGKNQIDLAYIANFTLNYSFPSTIVINVEERYPAYIALDKNTNSYYKIDNEGYLLEKCKLTDKKDELLVEGFAFESEVKLGEKINEVYLDKLKIYNTIKQLLEKYEIKGNITKLNFSNSLTTITLDDKLNVIFANDSNLEYKVSFLKGILQKNEQIVEGTIDMSIEDPVYSKYN